MQQCRMPRRIRDVDAAGQYRDRDTVGGECGAVRGAVDAVGTAGDHRDVALDQSDCQVPGDVLAVG